MSLTVTAWRLTGRHGQRAECIVAERDGRWRVLVQEGPAVTFAERCASDEAALERANQFWETLVARGWTELRH